MRTQATKAVVDVQFPDGSVSVLYIDLNSPEKFDRNEELKRLLEWAKEQEKNGHVSPLVEALLQYKNQAHVVLAGTGFTHRSAVAFKKQRIGVWKALGRRILTR